MFECVNEYAARSNVKYVKIYRFPRSVSFILSSYAQANERKNRSRIVMMHFLLDLKSYISLALFFFFLFFSSLTSLHFHTANVCRFGLIILLTAESDTSRPQRATKSIKFIDLQSWHIFLHTLKTNRIPRDADCHFLPSGEVTRGKDGQILLSLISLRFPMSTYLLLTYANQSNIILSLETIAFRLICIFSPLDLQDCRGGEREKVWRETKKREQ